MITLKIVEHCSTTPIQARNLDIESYNQAMAKSSRYSLTCQECLAELCFVRQGVCSPAHTQPAKLAVCNPLALKLVVQIKM